jgi:predicted glycosyltransferase
MEFTFIINTSAQAHFWKNIMKGLSDRGHKINIVARDYGPTTELLDSAIRSLSQLEIEPGGFSEP